jgi:hypothetical protein
LIEGAYFGVDGRPQASGDNCASVRQAFDDSGMPTYRECVGTNGNLALSLMGYARIRFAFDNRGNLKKLALFGVDDEPKLVNGIAGMLMEYDSRGNSVQSAHFGADGNAATDSQGIAKTNYTYNSRGQIIRADYFGLEGDPTLGTVGCASEQQELDDRGRVVGTICLGFRGSVINRMDGYAKATKAYDARGNLIEVARFDAEGKPAINSTSGVWKQTYTYDSRNVEIGAVYFDNFGREIPVDVVFSVIEFGSTAERIGLKPGDRILSYDGRKPTSEDQQISLVTDFSGRASRILIVRRGAQILTFEVAPGRLGAKLDVVRAEVDVIDTGRMRKN